MGTGICRGSIAAFVISVISLLTVTSQADASPGDPDRSFGKSGLVITHPDAPRDTVLRDFIELSGGRMLAVGGSSTGQNGVLVRYLPGGRIDPTFGGGDGIVLTPDSLWARAVTQADGKVVAFGRMGPEPAIARFLDSGDPDPSFGTGGSHVAGEIRDLFREPFANLEFIGPGIDSEGRIIAATIPAACAKVASPGTPCPNLPILRFTEDGQVDPDFGGGTGRILVGVGTNNRYRPGLIGLAPDDSIIVRSVPKHRPNYSGYVSQDYPGVVQRFSLDGTPDTSFGENGKFTYGHSESDDGRISVGPDGAITIVHQGVLKLDADGKPDPVFGENGYVDVSALDQGSELVPDSISSGGLLSDNGMMLAGTSSPYGKRSAYAIRLDPSGRPDPTFAGDGLAARSIGQRMPTQKIDSRRGLSFAGSIVHPDGSVTVGATARLNDRFSFALTRFVGGRTGKRRFCKGEPATVQGTPGKDRLSGGENSVVVAMGGDDIIRGSGLICSGAGDDVVRLGYEATLHAGSGDDQISGDPATVFGEGGRDRIKIDGGDLSGGAGNDRISSRGGRIHGDAGDDLIQTDFSRAWGDAGDDRITDRGEYGTDVLSGGPGNDVITGAGGPDRVDGGGGRDLIEGGEAADRLLGRAGADRIVGGPGDDYLRGGPGADVLDPGPGGPDYEIYGVHNRVARGQVKILGNRVKAESMRVWLRCSGTASHFTSGWMFDELNFKPSGRFREDVDFYDGFGQNVDGWMEGKRSRASIRVRYYLEDDFSYGENGSYRCRTGSRKPGARAVSFRLKRLPSQSQVVIQGGR